MPGNPHVVFIFPEGSESGTTYLAPETAFTFVLQAMHLQRVSSGELFPTAVTLKWFNACGRESKKMFTFCNERSLPKSFLISNSKRTAAVASHREALFQEEILWLTVKWQKQLEQSYTSSEPTANKFHNNVTCP